MKNTVKIIAVILIIVAFCMSTVISVSANTYEDKTPVCIRIVWHSKSVPYAAADVVFTQYSDPECTIETGENYAITFKKGRLWQDTVYLSPGYWRISAISPVNVWQEVIYGSSEMFEVKDHLITVYAGVAPSGETFELPDPWCVDGEDTRSFWIWKNENDTGDSGSNNTDNGETVDKIFVDDRSTKENQGLVSEEQTASESSQNRSESTKEDQTDEDTHITETQNTSSIVGTWVVMIILGIVVIGGVIYLVIKKRRH